MILLHNIGESPSKERRIASNYNTREEIQVCYEPLSFDGVYANVWENRDVLEGKDVTLFVMGDYVGGDNSFDTGMPPEEYCNWKQIEELVAMGARLGWHTWSHPDLTKLSYEEMLKEVMPPFPMDYFAYPYGRFNETVIEAVKNAGFKEAWSVTQGDNSQYARVRRYL